MIQEQKIKLVRVSLPVDALRRPTGTDEKARRAGDGSASFLSVRGGGSGFPLRLWTAPVSVERGLLAVLFDCFLISECGT